MKKYISLLGFCLSFCFYSDAQIINIPDANFKDLLVNFNCVDSDNNNSLDSNVDTNNDGEIQLVEALAITNLSVSSVGIESMVGIEYFTNIELLRCGIVSIDSLDLHGMTNLIELHCSTNNIEHLNVKGCSNLELLYCHRNKLTTLDLEGCYKLYLLSCFENNLTSLFAKDAKTPGSYHGYLNFHSNPDLAYICCKDSKLGIFKYKAEQAGLIDISINSYCTFTPGEVFYELNGECKLDIDNNGCDINDDFFPNLKFDISNGISSGIFIPNKNGNYSIPVGSGSHIISPVLEYADYFNISPDNLQVNFPIDGSPFVQDFCITPNGERHDLEITIIPLDAIRPGFDGNYKVVYRNRGNQIENVNIEFNYQEDVLDFVSSSASPILQNDGIITWNLGSLNPLQSGSILVTLNCNGPMDTPSVNNGDLLGFQAKVSGDYSDETPNDNDFNLHQTVVGSFDPNDKTCLEGNIITPEMVGDFVHYLIRFENTGTHFAENIVVTDIINTTTFDISTLQITDASHDLNTRIVNDNQVDFIFENIQLPFIDDNNEGYVAFRIKTVTTLEIGDSLINMAAIYFDFNTPILTNETHTTINYLDFDQDGFNNLDDCDDYDANINSNQIEVPYNGLDDDCNELTLDDDLDGDGFILSDDCDDNNENVNSDQIEVPYNGLDDDCNELTLDDDLDGDGFILSDDCDDNNENVNSDQIEVPYNGLDDDCNELTLDDDLDGDGFILADDCDDNNENVNSNQIEVAYNGLDDDCNELTLDDDLDGDGFILADDCDDNNENVNSNQIEVPYNGLDDDCNELTLDDDLDGDGFILADDCDDNNENVNSNQIEVPYNGLDDDCNELTLDDDLDGDGFILADDCDDNNENVNSDQIEVPYNGLDDDCNELTLDDDLDGDGFILADDCDDNNENVNPNQNEVPNNGIDDNCNNQIDEQVTSLGTISKTEFKLYPNPAKDFIYIETELSVNKIEIFDFTGQLTYQANVNGKFIKIETLPPGLYIFRIKSAGEFYCMKFTKI